MFVRALVLVVAALVCRPAVAQENVFQRMVGEWREVNTATTVIISPDGGVFAKTGPIRGSVERSITGGGNFSFENEKAKCSYDIVLLDDDTKASWGLVNEKIHEDGGASPGYCLKTGNLFRIETAAEKAKRMARVREEVERLEQVEADRRNKERQAEIDRQNRERQAEIDRLNRARQAEFERQNRERQAEAERQSLARQAESDRQDRERQAELARKEAEERRYREIAGDCDRLAAAPDDKDKPSGVPGMPWKEMKLFADEAVAACGKALKVFVDHPRLVFQMGRALQWSTDKNGGTRAFNLYSKAVEWRYPAAFDNLASMYRDGKVVPKSMPKAMDLWRRGAVLGDPGSAYYLAFWLLKDGNMDEGLQWLKKAADLGFEPATAMYQRYQAELQAAQDVPQPRQQLFQQPHVQPQQQSQPYQQQGRVPADAQLMLDIFGGIVRGVR